MKEKGLDSGKLAIELGRETWLGIAVVDFELLKEQLPKARFVDSGPVVWGCRLIKSEWEIECMRQGLRDRRNCLAAGLPGFAPRHSRLCGPEERVAILYRRRRGP